MSDIKFKWAVIGLIFAALMSALAGGTYLLVKKIDGWLSGDARVATVAQQQLELARQFKVLEAGIVQAQVTMVSKIDSKLLENFGDKVAEAIKATKAKPETAGQITASWKDGLSRRLGVEWDHVYGQPEDENYQLFKAIKATAADGREVPVAWLIFYPNKKEKSLKTGVYRLEYHADILRARQPDGGSQNYVKAYLTNDQDRASKGQKYPLDLKAEFKETWPESQFFWWAPRLAMGAFVSQDAAAGMGLGASLMGYGRSVADLDWRFLGLYALKDADNLRLGLEPFAWRLPLPFLHNTYLSPLLTLDWQDSLGSPTPGAALMVSVTF